MTVPTTVRQPTDVEDVRARVDAALERFLDVQQCRFDELIQDDKSRSEWASVFAGLRNFLLGGKRLRPAFCYWGWRGAGGDAREEGVVDAAASLELLHAFALVHDDIIDDSDTRRGLPSLHRQHADRHRRSGLRGSAEPFGASVALLLGDLCLGWFHEMLGASGMPVERLHAARELVSRGFTELITGQYLDLAEQSDPMHSVERASTVIQYKTAKYTIERPLHLGGVLAGAPPALLSAYSDYALPLGEAFQLRDDLLGAFGDPEITGKPASDDLRNRKATVLIATARQSASRIQCEEIDRMFAGPELSDDQISRLQAIIVDSGAMAACERRITDRARAATEVLQCMPVDDETRHVLADLVEAATQRIW